MEEVRFLRRWRVHLRGLSAAAFTVYLGKGHGQLGQDIAWHEGRSTVRCRGKCSRYVARNKFY